MFKRILLVLLLGLLILIGIVAFKTLTFTSVQIDVPPVEEIALREGAVERLAEAVRIPTISFEDRADIVYSNWDSLNALIDTSFPLVKKNFSLTKINDYSLLYKWEGKNTSEKPVMLIAHTDVVPVEQETLDKWEQGPFSGKVVDDVLWGRGTLDDKVSVFGILEAAEMLLQSGFQPERTIYFGFGHDEEISGLAGAKSIVAHLQKQGVQLAYVLDEGIVTTMGILPSITSPVAIIGLAEKGYVTLQLTVELDGGHSSTPAPETAIGVLSTAISTLQQNPLPANISEPFEQFMATVGPEMDMPYNMLFSNMWLFESVFLGEFSKLKSGNASIRTTTAPTIFRSGMKENAIPNLAQATVNHRIIPGETPEDVLRMVKAIINDERVQVEIAGKSNPATPVSSTTSYGYKVIEKTIRAVKPDAVVTPSLVIAATDSRYYYPIADDVYRYLPVRMNSADLSRIHGINECIPIANYEEAIRFYYWLMKGS